MCQMVGLLVNNEVKRVWKEKATVKFMYWCQFMHVNYPVLQPAFDLAYI
jgi:hypothetical protein